MDDFSWGNTRVVVGEGAHKKVLMDDDEKFDESMIPLKKFSGQWKLNSRRMGFADFSRQSTKLRHGKLRVDTLKKHTASHILRELLLAANTLPVAHKVPRSSLIIPPASPETSTAIQT